MMKKQLKSFLESFKFKKSFLYSLLVDAGFWILMVISGSLIYKFLVKQGEVIFRGMTAEQFQEYLGTAAAEELQAVLSNMKLFFTVGIITLIVFPIIVLVLYSLSQGLIWHILTNKKYQKKYLWRWMGENIVLFFILIGFLIAYLILRIIISLLTGSFDIAVGYTIDRIVFMLVLMAFIYLMLSAYLHLARHEKIFASLKETFKSIRSKFKATGFSYVMIIVMLVVLTLIHVLLSYAGLVIHPYITTVVSLLVLAWMRVYILKVTEE